MNSAPAFPERVLALRRGRMLEYLTIVWNLLEGLISVAAGLLAGSVALVGFGVDFIYRECIRRSRTLAVTRGPSRKKGTV